MDREILFRGKQTDNGEWVEGYVVKYPSGKTEIHKKCIEPPDVLLICEVEPETVCQYTGLTDKNGRKIWEGDIVKGVAYSSEFVGTIIWIDEIAGFGIRYSNDNRKSVAWEKSSILKAIRTGREDRFAAEVIGNIFENPELMEGCAKIKAALWKYDRELGWAYFCPDCKRFICSMGKCKCGAVIDLELPAVKYTGKVRY